MSHGRTGYWAPVLLSLLVGGFLGCGKPTPANVLLVTLDTTRADRFGFAGHAAAHTPHFDAFVRERAVRFADAVTAVPITLPSHTTILSGTYPVFHGVRDNDGYFVDEGVTTLAEILGPAGWSTAAVVAAFPLDSQFNLDQGFEIYDDEFESDWTFAERRAGGPLAVGFTQRAADRVNLAVFRRLPELREPFFLWVHYFDPHSPYSAPPPFDSMFATSRYDGEIAFMDEQFGRLLAELDAEGLSERTHVVVVGDHGESLYEHGEPSHAAYIYDASMKVPLLVAPADRRGAGRVVERQVRTLDVAPTVLELLGLEPTAEMQGLSLVPLLEGGADSDPREAILESLYPQLHFRWAPLRALRTEDWKLIQAPRPQLYDLRSDPGERVDVIARHPEKAAELADRLERLTRRLAAEDSGRSTSFQVDDETRSKLLALGYVTGSSADLRAARFPSPARLAEMVDPHGQSEVLKVRSLLYERMRRGHFEQAITMARRGLELDPDNPPLRLSLGQAQAGLGNHDKALRELRRAGELMPASPKPHGLAGKVLFAQGKIEAAIAEWDVALSLEPASIQTLELLAAAHLVQKDDVSATARLERMLELDPDYRGAHLELGRLFARTGRTASARAHLERVLELDPYSSIAETARDLLAGLGAGSG